MSPVARLRWSALWGVDLQTCKTMTNMLAPVEHANLVLSAWNSILDQNEVLLA